MASTPQHSHHRSGFIEHTAESVGKEFDMQGVLYVLSFWTGGWRRRNIHLRHNCLYMTLMRQGFIKRTFALDGQTVCEDNSTRPFCFTLTNGKGEKCFLAAENIASKELWMETIQANLSLLRLIGRRVRSDDHNRALNEYISRPILYIKVIRAKNLIAKDGNNFSDPYVKITVGSSTVKTTTRKKDLNPEWGMVFSFDWDVSLRFAIVEVWDEDYSSSDDFLGQVVIPLLPLRFMAEHESMTRWHPLIRRSSRDSYGGALQIEVSCANVSSLPLLPLPSPLDLFMAEVHKLPDFKVNLLGDEDGGGQIALREKKGGEVAWGEGVVVVGEKKVDDANGVGGEEKIADGGEVGELGLDEGKEAAKAGEEADAPVSSSESAQSAAPAYSPPEIDALCFPFTYPSPLFEQIEDVSLNVSLVCSYSGKKVSCPGVVILTNLRLLFISYHRIYKLGSEPSPSPHPRWMALGGYLPSTDPLDLSTEVYLGSVEKVHLSYEAQQAGAGTGVGYVDILKVRGEHRVFFLHFHNDSPTPPPAEVMARVWGDVLARTLTTHSVDPSPSVDGTGRSLRKMSIFGGGTAAALPPAPSILPLPPLPSGLDDSSLSPLLLAFLSLLASPLPALLEAADSAEGPAAHRIFSRLKHRTQNRPIERYVRGVEMGRVLNALRAACGLLPTPIPAYRDEAGAEVGESDGGLWGEAGIGVGVGAEESKADAAVAGGETTTNTAQVSPTATPFPPRLSSLCNLISSSPPLSRYYAKFFFNLENAYHAHDISREYRREGLPMHLFSLTSLNSSYGLCPTYPPLLAMPRAVGEDVVRQSAAYRSKSRLPVLTYYLPPRSANGSARPGVCISRSSQPLVGLGGHRSGGDEAIVDMLRRVGRGATGGAAALLGSFSEGVNATGESTFSPLTTDPSPNPSFLLSSLANASSLPPPFVIFDARPVLNARANQAVNRGGVEPSPPYPPVLHLDMPNIHSVRRALGEVEDSLYDDREGGGGGSGGMVGIGGVGSGGSGSGGYNNWVQLIRKILQGAMKIVYLMDVMGVSCLVHCSDGWDRTSQLTSLSMLMLDPYYRTIEGFIVLIEKEWMGYGHKFGDRGGWGDPEEKSPIFLQFLDCVAQLVKQFPNEFEFNLHLPGFLAHHISTALFNNFLYNNDKERNEYKYDTMGFSVFLPVYANKRVFTNPMYAGLGLAGGWGGGCLLPYLMRAKVGFWSEGFLGWGERLYLYTYLTQNDLSTVVMTVGGVGKTAMSPLSLLAPTSLSQFNPLSISPATTSSSPAQTSSSPQCSRCSLAFTWYYRRHSCRSCKECFCYKCAAEFRVLPGVNTKRKSRVCLDCAAALDSVLAEVDVSQKRARGNSAVLKRGETEL